MSLLLNMLCRFVIIFLPRSEHLLISQLQSPSTVTLETKKIKAVTASTFPPSICSFFNARMKEVKLTIFGGNDETQT